MDDEGDGRDSRSPAAFKRVVNEDYAVEQFRHLWIDAQVLIRFTTAPY